MSLEDEKNDQFKLVSIEGNSISSTANKAKQAYNSYLKEDEFSEGDFSEETAIEEVQEEVKPQKAKTQNLAKKGTNQLKKPSTAQLNTPVNKSGKKYDVDDNEDDVLFNEDGSINDGEDVKSNIEELKKSISELISGFVGTISALGAKLLSLAMKPLSIVIGILTKILNIPLSILNKIISSLANKLDKKKKELQPEEEYVAPVEEPVADIKKSAFSEMIELNIMFIDNYKKNLYTQPKGMAFKLSRAEEELIMSMTIEAIRECAEFTAELPPPVEGIYEGIPISKIMDEVTDEDVKIFLGFVKAFPGKYIGKSWKISETFATWLINNSPTG